MTIHFLYLIQLYISETIKENIELVSVVPNRKGGIKLILQENGDLREYVPYYFMKTTIRMNCIKKKSNNCDAVIVVEPFAGIYRYDEKKLKNNHIRRKLVLKEDDPLARIKN